MKYPALFPSFARAGRTSKARATIVDVVSEAVENNINYFDLIFNRARPGFRLRTCRK